MLKIFCLYDEFVNLQPLKKKIRLVEKDIAYGLIRGNELLRLGLNGGEPVLLKEVSPGSEEEFIVLYKQRFDKLLAEFTELENRILGTENKGSFLAKLINLKNLLPTHKGLGDYDFILNKIILYENQILDTIRGNRERNKGIKQALLLELEGVLKNNDSHEVGIAIKELKLRWMKTGNAEDSVNKEMEGRFSELTQSFFDKRQSFFDDKKKLVELRINKYDGVISSLEKIIGNGNIYKKTDRVKQLQADWKEIGHIPEKEYKARNAKYWELCKLFYNELRAGRKKSVVKVDFKDNLKLKLAIVEQLEEIKNKSLHQEVKPSLEEAKKVWKSIGKVPKGEVDTLNYSYMNLLDSISERSFIFQLACRKLKGFQKKSVGDRNKLLIKLVKELLFRDKNELDTFKGNMDNMHVNKGSFVDMLEKKLKNQEKRVTSKQSILDELRPAKKEVSKQ